MSYTGSCHCGEVKYEINAPIEKALECNCSICSRKGYLLTFVPAELFVLRTGSSLKDYQFGKKHIHHMYCGNCGVSTFGKGSGPDGKEMYAVNVRCIEGIDLKSLPIDQYDGKSK